MRLQLPALFRRAVIKISYLLNKCGNKKQCYICRKSFNSFWTLGTGSKGFSEYWRKLGIVGSDVDNFGCIYCGSHDRERHLFMYFDKLALWETIKSARVLHFAPETNLSSRISALNPGAYIKADLFPYAGDIQKMDVTAIPSPDSSFDIVIANHILEHVADYKQALREIYRVLTPGGFAIIQTPFSALLKNNFEDENINTNDLRLFFYGQTDHVRVFGENQLLHDIGNTGLHLRITRHEDFFDDHAAAYHGVNKNEYLLMAIKS